MSQFNVRKVAVLGAGVMGAQIAAHLVNCKVPKRYDPMQVPAIRAAADAVTQRLGGQGRVLLRASGTEPLVRVTHSNPPTAAAAASAIRMTKCAQLRD